MNNTTINTYHIYEIIGHKVGATINFPLRVLRQAKDFGIKRAEMQLGKHYQILETLITDDMKLVSDTEYYWQQKLGLVDNKAYSVDIGKDNASKNEAVKLKISKSLKKYFKLNGSHVQGTIRSNKTKKLLSVAKTEAAPIYNVDGIAFKGLVAIENKYGVSKMVARRYANNGDTLKRACTGNKIIPQTYVIDGIEFNGIKDIVSHFKVTRTVANRYAKNGDTFKRNRSGNIIKNQGNKK